MRFAAAALVLSACYVERAPATVDELVRATWTVFDKTPADIAAFATNAHEVLKGDTRKTTPARGRVKSLSDTDLAAFVVATKNPPKARGIYVYDRLDCTIAEIENLATAPNQKELFPGLYDDYTREYFSDRDAFLAGAMNRLQYATTLKASVVGNQYTSVATVEALRVPAPDAETIPTGPMLMLRQFLPGAAEFRGDGDFQQDYQVELFYPIPDGTTMHLYGVWREMRVGTFSADDDVTMTLILDGLIDYDKRMEKHCQAMR
ncbi:MAG: hypothetical protein IT381_08405 [Deltaproteobacteria bacterium]|nr:hypothetical protein [Deltaproteobacteria bacterium]